MSFFPHLRFSKVKSLRIGALIVFLGFLNGCAPFTQIDEPPRPGLEQKSIKDISRPVQDIKTKIGLLLPLSGDHASLGKSLLNAAEMVYFSTKPSSNIDLIIRDTQALGVTAAAKSLLAEKVDLIIGPIFATDTRAITGLVRTHKVPLITFSNDGTLAQPGVYVFGITPQQQLERIITYAHDQGIQRLVLFTPLTAYGQQIRRAAQSLVNLGKTSLVANITYTGHGEKLEKDIQKLQGQSIQGVLLPVGDGELQHLVDNLQNFGLDLSSRQLLGTMMWENLSSPSCLLQKGWFCAPRRSHYLAFEQQYQTFYDQEPKRLASLMADTLSMALTLQTEHQKDVFSTSNLCRAQGFKGLDGHFQFKATGFIERDLAIFEVTAQGPVLIP